MDREFDAVELRARRNRRLMGGAAALGALVLLYFISVSLLRPSIRRNAIATVRVARGVVDASVDASGTVIPAFEKVVSSPVDARVLRIERRAGDRVEPGDELVRLDISASQLDLARLDQRVAEKRSEQQQQRLRLDQDLVTLESQYEQKKLDAEILRYRAEQTATLRREGLASEQDRRMADVAAQKAVIEVAQLRRVIDSSRASGAAQVSAASSQLQLIGNERDEARRQLALAMTRADRHGVVTWVIADEGATVHKGDVLARIADLSSFRVVAALSDVHVARLTAGMPARVRLEGLDLMGTVASIDPRIENGMAKFYVDLDDKAHRRLRNNLRVDVFAISGRHSGVLQIPRAALGPAGNDQVWVVRGDEALKVAVKFGLIGAENAEVVAGLSEGDEVITTGMSDFEQFSKLKIKG